jgi:hypothetical protein
MPMLLVWVFSPNPNNAWAGTANSSVSPKTAKEIVLLRIEKSSLSELTKFDAFSLQWPCCRLPPKNFSQNLFAMPVPAPCAGHHKTSAARTAVATPRRA